MRSTRWVVLAVLGAGCEAGAPMDGTCQGDCDAGVVEDAGADVVMAVDRPTAMDTGRDVVTVDVPPIDGGRDTGPLDTGSRDVGTPDTGTRDSGSTPTDPGDPATRSASEVCARWSADRALRGALTAWQAASDRCANGTLPPNTRTAATQLTNTFRWLAGLLPVNESAGDINPAQACALMMERNGSLSHNPPMSWTCYSADGARGAAGSNIMGARGFTVTPWAAVQGWIDDSRDITMTLGHRRWMLYPPLAAATYGQTTGFACLYILGRNGNPRNRPWVAWPNQGVVPMEAMTQIWSFSASGMGVSSSTRVAVTVDGSPLSVTAMMRTSGYGDDTVSWTMPAIRDGAVYAITVSGLRGANVSYEVRPTRCP